MEITIEMIEQVLDATNGDYRVVKQALIDNEGDVEKAIEAVKAAQAEATVVDINEFRSGEAGDETEATDAEGGETGEEGPKKADWSTDQFAEDMVERIRSKIKEGNVSHIRIKKDDKVILDLPVNIGILGGVIGALAFPWAMVAAVLVGYGLNCKVEIITKDGDTEEL